MYINLSQKDILQTDLQGKQKIHAQSYYYHYNKKEWLRI